MRNQIKMWFFTSEVPTIRKYEMFLQLYAHVSLKPWPQIVCKPFPLALFMTSKIQYSFIWKMFNLSLFLKEYFHTIF